MKTKKGIVFEHTPSYSIFLTEDGRFQKGIPVSSAVFVGEEIEFQPYPSVVQKFLPAKKAWMAPVVAAVAIIFMFFSVLLPDQSNVLAFVQVDINPSVELGIDEDGDVQHFIGLNEEGVILKKEISFWKGKTLSNVLSTIVDSSKISNLEDPIEVTTIYKEKTHHESLENIITIAVAKSTQKVATKPIQIKEATIEERLKANEKGVSVDQFKQKLQKEKSSEPTKQNSPKVKPEKKQPKSPGKKDDNEKTKGKNNAPDKGNGKGKNPSKDSEDTKGNKGKQSKSENNAKRSSQDQHTDKSIGKKQENEGNKNHNANKKHHNENKKSNKAKENSGNQKNDKSNDKGKREKSKGYNRQ